MATEKQIAANQANAKLSHGPTSEEGLGASALNNFRHGLAVKTHEHFAFFKDEDSEAFQELLNSLAQEHDPTTETERLLVRRMAEYEWLRARALRFQAECLNVSLENLDTKKLALFIRYETAHSRSFYKALKELQTLREQKRNSEIGFESQQLKKAAETRAVEAQTLKREEFLWKKEVFQLKQQAQERRNTPQAAPETTSAGQQMAA